MIIKSTNGLKKHIFGLMKKKGFVPMSADVIGRYMLFSGIKRDRSELELKEYLKDNKEDPLDDFQITSFFVKIEKYFPGHKPNLSKKIIQSEIELLKNRINTVKNIEV